MKTRTYLDAVRDAFGFIRPAAPRPELGETDACLVVWSIRELNDLYIRTRGAVTARQPRTGDRADWEPAEEVYALALPVIRSLWRRAAPSAEPTVEDAAREDREYWTDRYDHAS